MLNIYINSEYLQLAEPLMAKYYDFHSTMFIDEIKDCVESSGVDYKKIVDGILTVDYDKTFRENKELTFLAEVLYKNSLEETFSKYFDILEADSTEEGTVTEDDIVFMCLTFMSYIYHKTNKGLFKQSSLLDDFDLEYESVLHYQIYPEMLSLYKMILESKAKNKSGAIISITNEDTKTKVKVNACSWFVDDMEKYFSNRFPDLTLDKIDNYLFQFKGKAGRKYSDRYTTNIIWGTYHLLRNHHSKFKDDKSSISKEICLFILDYLDYLGVDHSYTTEFEIKDILKHHIKHKYIPKWTSEWDVLFTDVLESPKIFEEMLNTQSRRYNINS